MRTRLASNTTALNKIRTARTAALGHMIMGRGRWTVGSHAFKMSIKLGSESIARDRQSFSTLELHTFGILFLDSLI